MTRHETHLLRLLGLASCFALCFVAVDMAINRSLEFWYLPWNLFLAWVPVIFSCLFVVKKRWPTYAKVLLFTCWLIFLPNTFYVITDIIHINDQVRRSQTLDTIVLATTIFPAFMLGLLSLWQIDQRLFSRFATWLRRSALIGTAVLCGFAIFIGRELRWNSWDVLVHPFALIRDIVLVILLPVGFMHLAIVTLAFAVCILGSYWLFHSHFLDRHVRR